MKYPDEVKRSRMEYLLVFFTAVAGLCALFLGLNLYVDMGKTADMRKEITAYKVRYQCVLNTGTKHTYTCANGVQIID